MPRVARRSEPGVLYHLISRFVDREWFITGEAERRRYLKLLGQSLRDSDWRCLAYAVMSNHIHLAVLAGEQPLASWMRGVHAPFADWMNRTHDRIGTMFVRGPKAMDIPPQKLGTVIAYIHNNPVRAGVVTAPRRSKWTSHRAYLGLEPPPDWLHAADGLARSGFRDGKEFDRWAADPSRELDDQRYEQAVLAKDMAARPPPAPSDRPDPLSIVRATAEVLALPVLALRSRRRGSGEQTGRAIAVHCAESVGITGVDIAAALGMSQQGVSAIRRRQVETQVVELAARVLRRLGVGVPNASGASSA